jgi:hypothetical protein
VEGTNANVFERNGYTVSATSGCCSESQVSGCSACKGDAKDIAEVHPTSLEPMESLLD